MAGAAGKHIFGTCPADPADGIGHALPAHVALESATRARRLCRDAAFLKSYMWSPDDHVEDTEAAWLNRTADRRVLNRKLPRASQFIGVLQQPGLQSNPGGDLRLT